MRRKRAEEKRKGTHANQYTAYWPIDQLVIEVELLKGTDSPASIARRLGYSNPHSLEKRLREHGYLQLARLFDVGRGAAA
jgi:hypothetical protein